MNFNVWKEIKKQFSYTKEKRVAIFRPEREDESNEGKHVETNVQSSNPPTNFRTQQLSKDLIAGEQAATSKGAESIEDDPIEEHQLAPAIISAQMSNEDYILSVLNDLPEQWIGKEMKLHAIVNKKDAIWIVNRILQDVERGLINAQFRVEEFNHLCDIIFTLKIAFGLASFPSAVTAINPVFSFILTDIKSETISRRKRQFSSASTH
jgi:hypothetical protein